MDQLVKLKRVNLAAIELLESLPHVIKKQSQLFVVIAADQLARRPSPSLLTFDLPDPDRIAHASNLPLIHTTAKCRLIDFRVSGRPPFCGPSGTHATISVCRTVLAVLRSRSSGAWMMTAD